MPFPSMSGLIAYSASSTFQKRENLFASPTSKRGLKNSSVLFADSPNSSSFTGFAPLRLTHARVPKKLTRQIQLPTLPEDEQLIPLF